MSRNLVAEVGAEATPEEFLEALWRVMDECWRVLEPSGSVFVNLGDKYVGSGGNTTYVRNEVRRSRRPQAASVRPKSLMLPGSGSPPAARTGAGSYEMR